MILVTSRIDMVGDATSQRLKKVMQTMAKHVTTSIQYNSRNDAGHSAWSARVRYANKRMHPTAASRVQKDTTAGLSSRCVDI
jgi:hypothetical protein